MKLSLIAIVILVVVSVACNKDKFQTKPTISIKSINNKTVGVNETFIITLECTDKEGDVQDSVIIIKRRLNIRPTATIRDTLRYKFPSFPNNMKTQVQATLDYQSILSAISPLTIPGSSPAQKEADTLILRLAVRDKAGNTSDTIETPTIFVRRQ